ncbi:hypothetical protein D3C73_1392140 [compost metagenome]
MIIQVLFQQKRILNGKIVVFDNHRIVVQQPETRDINGLTARGKLQLFKNVIAGDH